MRITSASKIYTLPDEQALGAIAQRLAHAICPGAIVFLEGPLGAGKTTFVRHFLACLGYTGKVKSPSYSVVESYSLRQHQVHHFDWFRLTDKSALEAMGFRDYLDGNAICLIEWPNQIPGFITHPDWQLTFSLVPNQPNARLLQCQPGLP